MGASLTALATVEALPDPAISDRARVVLMVMTNMALDADHPPTYFGGSARLARALGFPTGSASGARAVGRAIEQLLRAGYIRQVPDTKRSHNRRWEILIQLGDSTPVDDQENREQ